MMMAKKEGEDNEKKIRIECQEEWEEEEDDDKEEVQEEEEEEERLEGGREVI